MENLTYETNITWNILLLILCKRKLIWRRRIKLQKARVLDFILKFVSYFLAILSNPWPYLDSIKLTPRIKTITILSLSSAVPANLLIFSCEWWHQGWGEVGWEVFIPHSNDVSKIFLKIISTWLNSRKLKLIFWQVE